MATNRRSFLARLAAAGTVLATAPERIAARTVTRRRAHVTRKDCLFRSKGLCLLEFWHDLRKEFLIPQDEAFFNTGTLGSSPRIVREAVIDHMNHVDRDIAHWDYKPDHEQYFTGYAQELWVREKLARLINARARRRRTHTERDVRHELHRERVGPWSGRRSDRAGQCASGWTLWLAAERQAVRRERENDSPAAGAQRSGIDHQGRTRTPLHRRRGSGP